MSDNKIETMPENFGLLNQLSELLLAGNELLNFPNDRIDVLSSLLKLDLSRNHIDYMPEDMPYLYRVRVLLLFSNDLLELPKDIDKMKGLNVLDVHDNILEGLPEKLSKMPALTELNVTDNKIRTWPKSWETVRKKVASVVFDGQNHYKEREPRDRPVPVVEEPPPKKGKGAKGAKGGKGKKGAKGVKPPGTPAPAEDGNNNNSTARKSSAKAIGQSPTGKRDQQQ